MNEFYFELKKKMHVSDINDIFSMTFYTYDKIREVGWKNWDSAVSLYIRYIEQARLQWTDSTYSTDKFMMKAMWRSKDKFYVVKPILQNLWLIEPKEKRDENWKIISHYIQVNFIIKVETTTVLENQSLAEPESGKSDTNTICTKYKCLYTKNKCLWENWKKRAATSDRPNKQELLDAYRNDSRIATDFNEEDVSTWIDYKFSKKQYYATTKSFCTYLVTEKKEIQAWQPRLDIAKRFSYAVDIAIARWRDWIHWYQDTEQNYLASKKDLFPTPNQDER